MSSSTSPRSRPTASRPPAATTASTPRARRRWQARRAPPACAGSCTSPASTPRPASPGPYLAGRRRGDAAMLASGVESVAILRPSIMFGGRDSAFVKALARLVRFAPAVPVPGDGSVRLQMVWVEDVVRCIVQLADDMRPGQFPIGGPDQPTYDEILDIIGEGLGKRRVRKLHLPLPVFAAQAKAPLRAACPAAHAGRARAVRERQHDHRRRDRAAVQLPPARLRGARAPRGPVRIAAASERPRDQDLLEVLARAASRAPVDVPERARLELQAGALEDLAVQAQPVVDDDRERRAGAQAAGGRASARPPCRLRRRRRRARQSHGCGCRSPRAGGARERAAHRRRRAGRGSRSRPRRAERSRPRRPAARGAGRGHRGGAPRPRRPPGAAR